MVIASTLQSGNRASKHLARFHSAEATRSVQLYGVTPDSIDWACRCGCVLLWGREGGEAACACHGLGVWACGNWYTTSSKSHGSCNGCSFSSGCRVVYLKIRFTAACQTYSSLHWLFQHCST